MTAQEFLKWMDAMGFRKASEIVRCLDVSRNQAQVWVKQAHAGQDIDLKKTVALAMSASAKNLKPWGEPK